MLLKKIFLFTLLVGGCVEITSAQQIDSLQFLHSDVVSGFRAISVVNEKVVWVAGSNGKIGETLDGGKTWRWVKSPGGDSLDFRLLYAFSPQRLLVANAGAPAHIWLSNNGGHTWQQVYYNDQSGIFLDAVKFLNHRKGIIVGDPMGDSLFMLRTRDGGKTWQRYYQAHWPKMQPGEAFFAASNTNIAAVGSRHIWLATGGKVSRIFFSKNGGRKFVVYHCPVLQGKNSTGIFSIDFVNSHQGIVVGGDYISDNTRLSNAFYTSNGGKNWMAPIINPFGYRSCVIYVTPQLLLTTGTSGTDISYNGGGSWKVFSHHGFNVLQKDPKTKMIYFAGDKGQITKCIIQQ